MIKRFENSWGEWQEMRLLPNFYEQYAFRNFRQLNGITEPYMSLTETIRLGNICGWKEVQMSGFNPDDLQQCCAGSSDPTQATIYALGTFHTSGCPTLQGDFFEATIPNYEPLKKRCECGADSTPNPNCHSTWCPEYKK